MSIAKTHLKWMISIFLGFGFIYSSNLFFQNVHMKNVQEQKNMNDKISSLSAHVAQMINDAKTAKNLQSVITPDEIEKFLTPASRIFMTKNITKQSEIHNLLDLTYTLTPAKTLYDIKIHDETAMDTPLSDDALKNITQSYLTLEAKAPTDIDVINFIITLQKTSQGQLHLQKLILDPIDSDHFIKQKNASNIKFIADFRWRANLSSEVE